MAWHSPALIPFSTINNISILIKISNLILIFLNTAYHAIPGAGTKWVGSSSYIWRHICWKFSNTSANNGVSL